MGFKVTGLGWVFNFQLHSFIKCKSFFKCLTAQNWREKQTLFGHLGSSENPVNTEYCWIGEVTSKRASALLSLCLNTPNSTVRISPKFTVWELKDSYVSIHKKNSNVKCLQDKKLLNKKWYQKCIDSYSDALSRAHGMFFQMFSFHFSSLTPSVTSSIVNDKILISAALKETTNFR